ncbi:hypothetical protein K0A97_03480 [Patescibacteria group bacterium]|nr:hypothetical protein [Patescibacteria group bacterium]
MTRINFFLSLLILFFSLFASLNIASAQDFTHVISNSENWRDVYSSLHYSNLKGVSSDFLVSRNHGTILLNDINKNNFIRVISSSDRRFVVNYPSIIRDRDFRDVDELIVKNANLELIEELPDIKNFVIVGNTYGYNAIAAVPYAIQNNAWVFFADRTTIAEIDSILMNREVSNVLFYGHLEREIRDTLSKYNPEVINTGDRFLDNVEIVKKFAEKDSIRQVLLTNGEFIEKELMGGRQPILFTGKENVPTQIRDYIKSSDIEVGVLVGSDLVGAATNIRRDTGISVIVKFARGARSPTGAVSAVEGLDLYFLPFPILNLTLNSVRYNTATSNLEVTYESQSNSPIYFRGQIDLKGEDGRNIASVGDMDSVFISPNEFKTMIYPGVTLPGGEEITAEVYALYGESTNSLEKILQGSVILQRVSVIDNCDLEFLKVDYIKPQKVFSIRVRNLGSADCWTNAELVDIIFEGEKITVGSGEAILIRDGKKGNIIIEKDMEDIDLEDNPFVDLVVYYGERKEGLVNTFRGRFELGIVWISTTIVFLILILLIILLFWIFLLAKRRRRKRR